MNALTVTATVTPTACTPCNGTITASASAGTAPYQYSIDGGVTWQSSGLFSGLCAATYTITAIDAVSATATTVVTVVQNPPLSFTLSGVNCSNMNSCDGQIIVNITGGVPPYTINVQGPSPGTYTSSPITNRCPGTYTVTVNDASNNCGFGYNNPQTIVITGGAPAGPGGLFCQAYLQVGQCQIVCDNILYTSASGGTPPYQFSVNGGPYTSATSYPNQCEGNNTYTVCVRDAAMNIWCGSAYLPTNLTYNRLPPNVTSSGCPCNGTIYFANPALPGEQFYIYQNSVLIGQNSTGSFTGLCPGTYLLNSYYNGCWLIFPNVVVPGTPTFTVAVTTTAPTCYNSCNASITCTPSPWSPTGYQYSKDNGTTWQASNTFSSLCAATYTILVRDSVNCYGSYTQNIANPAQLSLISTVSQPNCANGNCFGAIICTPATGPTGPYEWSNNNGVTWQTSNQFLNLCSGTYQMMVRDANLCSRSGTATLSAVTNQYSANNTRVNPTCANPCSGSITITLGPSNAPAAFNQFSIDSGVTWQATANFNNLCAGTYYGRVRNTLTGCYSSVQTIVLLAPTPQALTATSPQPSCASSCNGTIQATFVSGTNPPYSYSIDGGVTWQSSTLFTGVCAGTYTVTIINSINCTGTQTVVVNSTPVVPVSATTSSTACYGDCNGTITAFPVTGPADPYQYSINGNNWYVSNLFNGVCAGNYTLQVKDSFNCITTIPVTVISPPAVISSFSTLPPLCSDVCNGSISLNPSQPSGYTYSIDSGLTWQTTNNYSNLCAGLYDAMIRDSAGCVADSLLTIIAPPPITATTGVTSISCSNMCDGAITLNASPAGTYSYSLDSGATWQASSIFTNLCAGSYDYEIADTNGCGGYGNITMIDPPAITIQHSTTQILCYGDSAGSVQLSSNAFNCQYSIDSGMTWTTDSAFYNLPAGTYSVLLTDGNGCTSSTSFSLTSPPLLWVSTACLDPSYCPCTGALTPFAYGGVPGYSYSISPGSSFTQLCPGNYIVTATDSNGCTTAEPFTVYAAPPITIDSIVSTPAVAPNNDGTATVYFSGGFMQYNIQWDAAAGPQWGNTATNLAPGTYCVTVTDGVGCQDTACITVGVITHVDPVTQVQYSVYPNPASNLFIVEGVSKEVNVRLYDASGRIAIDYGAVQMNPAGQSFDLPLELAEGNYILEMASGDAVLRKQITIVR